VTLRCRNAVKRRDVDNLGRNPVAGEGLSADGSWKQSREYGGLVIVDIAEPIAGSSTASLS